MDSFYGEEENTVSLKNVYNQLQDDISRQIYLSRSLYSLTDEKKYMKEIVRNSVLGKVLLEKVAMTKKKVALFGAGTWGKSIVNFFPDIKVDCFIDNKKSGQTINGLKVFSFDDMRPKLHEYYIVISILFNYQSVVAQFMNEGISKQNLLILGKMAEECQYFDLDVLQHCPEEIFVDCGGFQGETSEQFIRWCGGDYRKIYLFEPNSDLMHKCKNNLSKITTPDKIKYYECGLWNEDTILRLKKGQDIAGDRTIQTDVVSGEEIHVKSIDSVISNKRATFIKMDIEGSELRALQGAVNTIKKSRPKLAISVYHKRNDIWDIPIFLLRIHPDYKMYLRTYSFSGNDTVLYAV